MNIPGLSLTAQTSVTTLAEQVAPALSQAAADLRAVANTGGDCAPAAQMLGARLAYAQRLLEDAIETLTPTLHDYASAALDGLVQPDDGCATRRFDSNAEIRQRLQAAIADHPEADGISVEQVLKDLALPSLLRDEPGFQPGSDKALRYDLGLFAYSIGRAGSDDGPLPTVADALRWGESELRLMMPPEPYRDALNDHRPIFAFHQLASGALDALARDQPVKLDYADFAAHLAGCAQRADPAQGDVPAPCTPAQPTRDDDDDDDDDDDAPASGGCRIT